MNFKKEVSLLIPAYNEEGGIGSVIQGLEQAFQGSGWRSEIIVVDDGSSDRTAEEARRAGAKVIVHPKNVGYGGALRTGIENASYDWIATIDADCSYPPHVITKLLPFVPAHDMVVGARQGRHYWGTILKHPARLMFLALAQFVVGHRIPDVNSGLRLFRRSIVREMLPRLCRGFSFSTTLTLSFLSSHRFVHFEPIHYLSRVGTSKVRYIRDTLRTLQLMLETIVYYNPMKVGVLLMGFPLLGGLAFLTAALYTGKVQFLFAAFAALCWSIVFLGVGCILLLLAQATAPRRPE